MNVVHEMVISLDNLEALYGRLRVLGVFHVRHQVNMMMMMMMMMFHVRHQVPHRYLDIMGPIFCNAVRPILLHSDAWCPEAGGYSAMDRKKNKFSDIFFSNLSFAKYSPLLQGGGGVDGGVQGAHHDHEEEL